ncbi:hypothetical protein RB653_002771 [Dictyostelium firmibasis]|uniref:LIM zinc-binding domain-containing protein n=1 Tax=Dictyostelium firmibasis TaxID=79012 RepID=A0AAN7TYD6_9MYCE
MSTTENIIHNNSNKCCKCSEVIKGEMIVLTEEEKFHKECFKCEQCNCEMSSFYVSSDKKRLCKDCNDKKSSVDCNKCKKPILGSKLTDNSGKVYHVDCFSCEQCSCKIDGAYFIRNELPYCAKCNEELKKEQAANNSREIGKCFQCKKSILNSTPMVIVTPEEKYHKNCLKCFKCKQEIEGQFQVLDNIASKHYVCMKCN